MAVDNSEDENEEAQILVDSEISDDANPEEVVARDRTSMCKTVPTMLPICSFMFGKRALRPCFLVIFSEKECNRKVSGCQNHLKVEPSGHLGKKGHSHLI